jgi:hypothetical protein
MDPIPGGESHGSDCEAESDDETCDRCGRELEWTLDHDGVQRRECPHCE